MARHLTVRLSVLFVLVCAALALSSLAASAAPSPTPNGLIGACNMLQSWPGVGPGVPAGGGMENAMSSDAPQGNAGMATAAAASGASC
jgi:hypothetical protein